jgi:hypothetical protein
VQRSKPGRPERLSRRGAAPAPEVYGITTARRGQRDDVHDRMVKYAVSMGVRMVCLVLAFVVHGWLAWVFVAGAVILPYVAVLLANAGRETAPRAPTTLIGAGGGAPRQLALGAAPRRPAPAPGGPARPAGASARTGTSARTGASAPPAGQWQHAYRPPGARAS